ncbi:MAG TPA: ATP-binding protein [Candidatus Solibacter sp.]|jgi:CheY-like chemotaxis protein|nr:ATP-binding protein [Candidatus Solibacter sp.]
MRTPFSLRFQAALLLIAAVVVVTAVFSLIRSGGAHVDQLASSLTTIQDFDTANQQLLDAMVSQESGLRGYTLTGDPTFLQPYQSARVRLTTAEQAMSNPPSGLASLLSAEEHAASTWQRWAETRVAIVPTQGPGATVDDSQGRLLFDSFRSDWSALDQRDTSLEIATKAELTSQLSQQSITRGAGWLAVMILLTALALVVFFRILRPLVDQARAGLALDGETLVDIPGKGRGDEIGQLAGALDALQETLRERGSLTRAVAEIGGRAELTDVANTSTRIFAEQLGADEAMVLLADEKSLYVAGAHAGLFAPGHVLTQDVPTDEDLVNLATVTSSIDQLPPGEIRDAVAAAGYGPFLSLAMVSGGEVAGIVCALRTSGRMPFGPAEIRSAEILAPVIGAATEVARLVGEIKDANQVKSKFLANMSHELRTPLNAILGFSQVLAAGDFGPLNERQERYVAHIETSGGRLLDLINDILDLAKVEAGLLEMRPERLELAQLMIAGRSEIERLAATKRINLVYDLTPGVWVWTEPRRLQQVVVNLLTNAVKFTPSGGRVRLATAAVNGHAEITVSDTGIGIAPEEQERIFDEFVQADDDRVREQKGTGLGLSLSRKLTELMEGSLTVESEVGKGSTFTVTMRLSDPERISSDGPLVLVVEDEVSSTELLEVILLDAGYRVTSVGNVDEASEAVRRELPRAVLLDISLPGPNGWTFLEELKAHPETREVPVVAVTALDEPRPEHRRHLSGFFTKPVAREALVGLLAEVTPRVQEPVEVG